jgi:hypothetical protein
MSKNKYTYLEAQTEAQAWLDPTLSWMADAVRAGTGRDIDTELTVAKIIEIESQKATNILWFSLWNKTVTGLPAGERSIVDSSKNALWQASWARSEINKLEELAKKEPIEKSVLLRIQSDLNILWTRRAPAICSTRDLIILFAGVKREITNKLIDTPTMVLANFTSTLPNPITDIPFTIEWTKWANENIEILDSGDRVLDSFPWTPSDTSFKCDKIKDLKSGRNTIKIRATNTTTKVYSEYIHTCVVDIPEAPENFNQNPTITALPGVITGTLKNKHHTVQLLQPDGTTVIASGALTWTPTTWPASETIQVYANGTFRITIPTLTNGPHNYQVWILWTGTTASKVPLTITADLKTLPTDILPEAPEWIQTNIDITTEPHTITGKLKNPKHEVELLSDAKWPLTPIKKPTIAPDGSFSIELPRCGTNRKIKYYLRVNNKKVPLWPNDQLDIEINVKNKKAPEKVWIIKWYDIKGLAAKAKKDKTTQNYRISTHTTGTPPSPTDFRIEYARHGRDMFPKFYAQVPNEHNHFHPGTIDIVARPDEFVRAKSVEELEKNIYERLHDINHHRETEYNAELGIIAPEEDHGKEEGKKGEHKEKEGEKEKEEGHDESDHEKWHDKWHEEWHGHASKESSWLDKGINKVFGDGLIGKTLIKAKNFIPAPARKTCARSVYVGSAIYGWSLILGSAALASAIVPAMGITATYYAIEGLVNYIKNRGKGSSAEHH